MDLQEWINLWFGSNAQVNENKEITWLSVTDASGNEIAVFHEKGGWRFVLTDAESARHQELLALYNAAFDAVFHAPNVNSPTINAGNNMSVLLP